MLAETTYLTILLNRAKKVYSLKIILFSADFYNVINVAPNESLPDIRTFQESTFGRFSDLLIYIQTQGVY